MTDQQSDGDQQSGGPLRGLLVVAVEQAVAAPLCTARLADAGARVIKVERAGGDFARGYDQAAGGDSSYFAWANHGKESLVLDIKDEADAALLDRIIARADVLVQNLAPGALARAGFDPVQLRGRHERLITCDISGYGDGEAVQGLKAYDLLVQAESGLLAVSGGEDSPGRIGVSLCDIGTGVTAYGAILEALIQRSVSGKGTGLAVSLFDVAAEWMTVPLVHAETGDGAPGRVGLRHPSIAPYGGYETGDGRLTLIAVQNEREWDRLCREALSRPDLADDERFAGNVARVENRDALEAELQAVTATLSSEELRSRLRRASVAYGALNSVDELSAHPALRRRSLTSSSGVALSLPAHPVLNDARNTADGLGRRVVPTPGQHTAAIRAEFSGR